MKQITKRRIIKDYNKLDKEFRDRIKRYYSTGYSGNIISFYDAKGKKVNVLPFETEDTCYMLRVVLAKSGKKIRKNGSNQGDSNGWVHEDSDAVESSGPDDHDFLVDEYE